MKSRVKNLVWNVYIQDFNAREIKAVNVFDSGRFQSDVEKLLNETLDRKEFSERLRRTAMYYFWSKCEFEVVVTSWPPYITKEELARLNEKEVRVRTDVALSVGEKIDVYDQLLLNWERFVDYTFAASKGAQAE